MDGVPGLRESPTGRRHKPVLLGALLETVAPVRGVWVDCTYGAGCYARALVNAGADRVFGIDRDPDALSAADSSGVDERVRLVGGLFGDFDALPEIAGRLPVDGVVFDLGVSSPQLDQAERGFSFMRDGPLDMRMSRTGISAAEIVNSASEERLAEIFRRYGEEKAARSVARRIAERRRSAPIATTGQLSEIISGAARAGRKGAAHPATRCFQALRIAVNDELRQLSSGLCASERALRPGGILAVISFHSLEDRIVKQFLRSKGGAASGSRHQPPAIRAQATFEPVLRKPATPGSAEVSANPRSRSAKLRVARRTAARAAAATEFAVLPESFEGSVH